MAYPRSQRSRAIRMAVRTAGSITGITNTAINVDTALDMVLQAQVGDVLEYTINGVAAASGTINLILDVATMVAGSPVNYFGTFDGTIERGVWAWFVTNITPEQAIGGSAWRTLVAGDLSGGTCTVRLRAIASGASATIYATVPIPLHVMVRNLGPVSPH